MAKNIVKKKLWNLRPSFSDKFVSIPKANGKEERKLIPPKWILWYFVKYRNMKKGGAPKRIPKIDAE